MIVYIINGVQEAIVFMTPILVVIGLTWLLYALGTILCGKLP